MIYGVRIHSRGGQGGKIAAKIIGHAAFIGGKDAQSFALYGGERRGAPVAAFVRIDDKKILERGYIENPDCVMVFDDTLIKEKIGAFDNIKENGCIIINSNEKITEIKKQIEKLLPKSVKIYILDATSIAMKNIGKNIINTTMIGAFAKITKKIDEKDAIEAIKEELVRKKEYIESNVSCFNDGYNSV